MTVCLCFTDGKIHFLWASEILPHNQDKIGGSMRLSVLEHVGFV